MLWNKKNVRQTVVRCETNHGETKSMRRKVGRSCWKLSSKEELARGSAEAEKTRWSRPQKAWSLREGEESEAWPLAHLGEGEQVDKIVLFLLSEVAHGVLAEKFAALFLSSCTRETVTNNKKAK